MKTASFMMFVCKHHNTQFDTYSSNKGTITGPGGPQQPQQLVALDGAGVPIRIANRKVRCVIEIALFEPQTAQGNRCSDLPRKVIEGEARIRGAEELGDRLQ